MVSLPGDLSSGERGLFLAVVERLLRLRTGGATNLPARRCFTVPGAQELDVAKRRLCLIVVAAPERLMTLHEVVDAAGLDAVAARSCLEARRLLEKHSNVDLVIVDLRLPGGNWTDVLAYVAEAKLAARLLVSSPFVEEKLLADVLARGGFDVLLEPYEAGEVKRVVETALQAAQTSNLKRKLASRVKDRE